MQNSQNLQTDAEQDHLGPTLVNAETIGDQYGVTGRFILQLAAERKIPCLRLGRKCVRFDPVAVARAFDEPNFGAPESSDETKPTPASG